MQLASMQSTSNFVPINVARICQRTYDNVIPFASPAQRKQAWNAFQDLDLDTLRSLERELDLI